MSAFSKGDRVEIIGSADEGLGAGFPVGGTGTVHTLHLFPDDGMVYVRLDGEDAMHAWFPPANLRKVEPAAEPEDKDDLYVEPEPLREGDWVQVWARVDRLRSDGDTVIRLFYGVKHADGTPKDYYEERVRNDAIVRPDAGQVPPWVKPAQCTSLYQGAPGHALWRCTKTEHDDDVPHGTAGSCSVWSTYEEAGRITEGGAS